MTSNLEQREEQSEAWKRSLAGQLAHRHDEEDRRDRVRVYAAATAFLLGCAAIGGCLMRTTVEGFEAAVEDASGPPDVWATDGAEEEDAGAVPVIARPMPAKPFPEQKRGECAADEKTINGGCWMELVRKPGADNCGTKAFAYDGKCWIPVKQVKRPPTSVEP